MSRPVMRRGRGLAGLSALVDRLSERDRTLLAELGRHRFLTTEHVRRLCFTDQASLISAARSTRRVLARLENWQLIERLSRRVGGMSGGAAMSTWLLTEAGQRLLGILNGTGAAVRVRRLGGQQIAHHLAVADTHLALREAAAEGRFDLLTLDLEPASWRYFSDDVGGARILKPDMFIISATPKYEDHWFIEVDRGTEGIPTLLRQCQAYARYRATGREQGRTEVFPRVIWLLPSNRRRNQLLDAIGKAHHLDRSLFYAQVTPEQLVDFVAGDAS